MLVRVTCDQRLRGDILCSAQVMLATAFQSKQQARCAIQDRAVLLSRVFPEPDGALLAGSGVCEQKREREHECERMAWHGELSRWLCQLMMNAEMHTCIDGWSERAYFVV